MPEKNDLNMSMFLSDYLTDCKEGFQVINNALLALEKDNSRIDLLDNVFRRFHTLKSSSAMLEFTDIAELAHKSEDLLDKLSRQELPLNQEIIDTLFEVADKLELMVGERAAKKRGGTDHTEINRKIKRLLSKRGKSPRTEVNKSPQVALPTIEKIHSVKVDINLLDTMFNTVGELIITKKRIDNIIADIPSKELKKALASMDPMISELQENISIARLVPVGEILQKFPRMVRDLTREAGKEAELIIEGSEIELDKAVLDAISEPLIHLLRNAIDHGIEPPAAREQSGRNRVGTIRLAARRTENHILIKIDDDGAGIDTSNIKKLFIKKGHITTAQADAMEEDDVLELLFQSGTSTADKVTEISGRGIGLDVVRNSVREIGGTVEMATEKGKGTHFTLKLPLTTAVMQTLMIGVGSHVFAIPSDIVQETLEVKPQDIKDIQNEQALLLREEVIPFIKLQQVLGLPSEENQEMTAIVVQRGDRLIGLGVDSVVDHTENIIKPFDPLARQFKGFSGGTILGDGSVALLLDIPELLGLETLQKEDSPA